MPDIGVFISYRRSDTSADAGRLYDALRRRFGRDSLFMDVDSLRPGDDWVEAIEEAIGNSDVLLAVIGAEWTDVRDDDGGRRLDDPLDRVRLEIETALKLDKAVIPVVIGETRMPRASDLPDSLQPLLRRHAIHISHSTFDADLRGLLQALRVIEREKEASAPPPPVEQAPVSVAPIEPEPPPAPAYQPPDYVPPPEYVPPPPPPPAYYTPPPSAPTYYAPPPSPPTGPSGGFGIDPRLVLLGIGVLGVLVIGFGAWQVLGQARQQPTLPPTLGPTFAPVTFAPSPPVSFSPQTAGPQTAVPGPTFDFSLQPRVGSVSLTSGFTPDPFGTAITPIQEVDASYLGLIGCRGMAGTAPDFRLIYTAGSQPLLRFFVDGLADTGLVINDPNGVWYCNDDSVGLSPKIDFSAPIGGRYDIWVTNVDGDVQPATLIITENALMEPT